jgi:MFS family permease
MWYNFICIVYFTGIGLGLSCILCFICIVYFTGIGLGLTFIPSVTIINFYFEKRRAFANGFLTASMGLASLVYPLLYRTLIDKYGLHGIKVQ